MSNRINFTMTEIENLPNPSSGRATYHDIKQPGLQLRVTANGVKTFSVYKRTKNGAPERITLGRYPDMKPEKARVQALQYISSIVSGQNPAEVKRAIKGEMTFADLFSAYIERHAKIRKSSWARDIANYNLYLQSLGKKRLSSIKRADVAEIHTHVMKGPKRRWVKEGEIDFTTAKVVKSGATANRILALVSSVFGWGINAGLCEENPARGIRKNPEKSRSRFLQSDELGRFFNALSEEENEITRDSFLISLLTGARRANVLAMRWDQISFERKEWQIPVTKNGDPQTVTLTDEAIQVLINRRKDNQETGLPEKNLEFVFPSISRAGHITEPRKAWERVLNRAGLEDLRIHDLRRTLGSWQAKTGASLVIIGKSLNHKHQSTTQIYARLDLDPVRESVEKATEAMLKAGRIILPN